MTALKAAGYHAITQAQLFDALYHHAALPAKPIIISVDDGYVDDVTRDPADAPTPALVATFFVITGRMTEPGFLTAAQIRELDRAGMDIGDHTAHHVDLRLLTPSELRTETAGSRRCSSRSSATRCTRSPIRSGPRTRASWRRYGRPGSRWPTPPPAASPRRPRAPLTMPRVHVGRAETPCGLLSLLGGA